MRKGETTSSCLGTALANAGTVAKWDVGDAGGSAGLKTENDDKG